MRLHPALVDIREENDSRAFVARKRRKNLKKRMHRWTRHGRFYRIGRAIRNRYGELLAIFHARGCARGCARGIRELASLSSIVAANLSLSLSFFLSGGASGGTAS